MMTLGSLFSGIGGLELGFERTGGFVTRWQVENDPYATKVLAKHWPEVKRYGDITKLDAAELERVDVIVGGFPCQDVSVAGKGAGLDGARSGLWSEYIRIVRALRPRYVVVENVPGLFVRGFGRVLGDLAQSGYDAEWQVLSAAGVGAPHRRERVIILAHTQSGQNDQRKRRDMVTAPSRWQGVNAAPIIGSKDATDPAGHRRRTGWTGRPPGDGADGQDQQAQPVAHAQNTHWRANDSAPLGWLSRQSGGSDSPRGTGGNWWAVEPNVGRVANGVPSRVDRLRCLGNAVVPQVAQYVAECVLQHAQQVTP